MRIRTAVDFYYMPQYPKMPQKGFLRRETEKWAFFPVCKCHEPGLSTHECLNIMFCPATTKEKSCLKRFLLSHCKKKFNGLGSESRKND